MDECMLVWLDVVAYVHGHGLGHVPCDGPSYVGWALMVGYNMDHWWVEAKAGCYVVCMADTGWLESCPTLVDYQDDCMVSD